MSSIAVPPSGGRAVRSRVPVRWRPPVRKRWIWIVVGGLAFGAAAGYLGTSGSATRILMLAAILLPLLLWRRPYLSPAVLLSAAILVEQGVDGPHIPITEKIPMFVGIGPGHLQGADILLLMVLFIYCVKSAEWGPRWFPRTHVSLAVRCVLACVALAVVIGQAHHGALRMALMEARPYVYLAATYFLATVFIRDRRAIRGMLWAFVGSVAFKAAQGIYVWIQNRHMYPKPESYISHEASYFFVIYMVLVLTLWLYDQKGSMRTWATRLLPLVIFANTVNDRRAAWEMLGGALLCFGVITYKALPIRRHLLGKAIVGLVLISAVYFPVMWNSTSSLGMPARAIKSQITPSSRDADSDTYRIQENANLELNIKQDGLLGKGFGVKIDYALPISDISSTDPLIAYIPHNDVLDVLMRMGLLGGVAMWGLIAAGIIMGGRLATTKDRELAAIGMLLACSIVAYALMGAVDQGFYFFRIAFITGSLLGLGEAARRLAREEPASVPAAHAGTISPMPARVEPRRTAIPEVGEGLSLRRVSAAAQMAAPRRRISVPGPANLEPSALLDRLPRSEEQAILELIERWDWLNRSRRTLAYRGSDTGVAFASPSMLLRDGAGRRVLLPGEAFGARPAADLPIATGRVASSMVDVVVCDWIGYLRGTGRQGSPTALLLAAALVNQKRRPGPGPGVAVAADTRYLRAPMTVIQHGGRPRAAVDPAHTGSLFSYLVGDVPDLHRLTTDPAVLKAELTRIHREHGSIRLHAFVGYGPRGRIR